jgi:hypothetical protein
MLAYPLILHAPPMLRVLAVAAELRLRGCRIRAARAVPGTPTIEIDPPRRGVLTTYARSIPVAAGITLPMQCSAMLRGVRVTWTPRTRAERGERRRG